MNDYHLKVNHGSKRKMRSNYWAFICFVCIASALASDILPLSSGKTAQHPQNEASVDTKQIVSALLPVDGENNHAYWYRRLFGVELSPEELACARNGTVLHRASENCYWLLEQGPCAASEWLQLTTTSSSAVCGPRPCEPDHALVQSEGSTRCAPLDASLCKQHSGRRLRVSLHGEARCHCTGFRALGPDGQCHALYAQGTCPSGQVLMPFLDSSLDTMVGSCVPSSCAEDHLPILTEDSKEITCMPRNSLTCEPNFLPLFDTLVGPKVPVCDSAERNSIQIAVHKNSCVPDNRGTCSSSRN